MEESCANPSSAKLMEGKEEEEEEDLRLIYHEYTFNSVLLPFKLEIKLRKNTNL